MVFEEQQRRSVIKGITHRILIIIATAIITWVITKQFDLTVGITVTSAVVNTIIYYIHERVWNRISWGKEKSKHKN